MSVYIAPEIKDRVAVGDDLYKITDSGGKKKLTPSPTEVSEVGTAINKALMQPLCDAVERLDNTMLPYSQYWWRWHTVADSYYITLMTPTDGATESYVQNEQIYVDTWFYFLRSSYVSPTSDITSCTVQYSSSVALSQVDGTISLVSPSTITVNETNVGSNEIKNLFLGKYVKGLYPYPAKIRYIPESGYITTRSYAKADDTTSYIGFMSSTYTYFGETDVKELQSAKATSVGDWEYVSSSNLEQYPHSGMQNGMEYQYLGLIYDIAAKSASFEVQTVNITSASWQNKQYSIQIPMTRYYLFLTGASLVIDSAKIYGGGAVGDSSVTVTADSITLSATVSGVTLTYTGTKAKALTLVYLPFV